MLDNENSARAAPTGNARPDVPPAGFAGGPPNADLEDALESLTDVIDRLHRVSFLRVLTQRRLPNI